MARAYTRRAARAQRHAFSEIACGRGVVRNQLPEDTHTGIDLGAGASAADKPLLDLLNMSSASVLLHVVTLSITGPSANSGASIHFGASTFDTVRRDASGDELMDPILHNGPVEDLLSVKYVDLSTPPAGQFAVPTTFPVFHRRVSVQRDWSINTQDSSAPTGNPPLARYLTGWALIETPSTVGTYEFSWAHELTVIAR